MSIFVKTVLLAQVAVFFLNFILGIAVIRANRRSLLNQLFGVYAFSLAFWNISLFSTITEIGGPMIQLWWSRLAFSFYLLMINGFLYFVILYPAGRARRLFNYIFWLFTTILAFLTLTPYLIKGNIKIIDGFITGDIGPLISFFSWYYVALIILSLIIIALKLFKTVGIEKIRLFYILGGFVVFAVPMILTNMILPVFFGIFKYNNLGPLFSLPMLAIIAYAIVRYRLMNIWIVIRKGTIFTLLLAIVIFIFVFLNNLIGGYIKEPFNYLIPSLIITGGIFPLKKFLESATDKIFFKKHYKFADVINQLEEIIHSAGLNLDETLEKFNNAIIKALKIEKAAVLILIPKDHFISRQTIEREKANFEIKFDNPIVDYFRSRGKDILNKEELEAQNVKESAADEIEKLGFSLAAAIKIKNRLVGIYLLGQKKSQDPFIEEDTRLLKHVAGEIGVVIDNARMFEELKTLDKAKSEFISVVSHQLRTPISIIRWNLELVSEQKTYRGKKNEFIESAYNSVVNLGHQIDQLLTALEIEESRFSLSKKDCDLNSLIKEESAQFAKIAGNKNIDFNLNLAETALPIKCDADAVKKTLNVFLENAVSYTPKGGAVKISSFKKSLNGKEQCVVSVTDSGIGMAESDKNGIFKKFFRSDTAKNVSPNGLGLDLFIAKNFIDNHGGDIWFESAGPNKGSVFCFSITSE